MIRNKAFSFSNLHVTFLYGATIMKSRVLFSSILISGIIALSLTFIVVINDKHKHTFSSNVNVVKRSIPSVETEHEVDRNSNIDNKFGLIFEQSEEEVDDEEDIRTAGIDKLIVIY